MPLNGIVTNYDYSICAWEGLNNLDYVVFISKFSYMSDETMIYIYMYKFKIGEGLTNNEDGLMWTTNDGDVGEKQESWSIILIAVNLYLVKS